MKRNKKRQKKNQGGGDVQWEALHLLPYGAKQQELGYRVGAATRLRIERSEIRIPAVAREFSLCKNVQTDPGAHDASYPIGTGVVS